MTNSEHLHPEVLHEGTLPETGHTLPDEREALVEGVSDVSFKEYMQDAYDNLAPFGKNTSRYDVRETYRYLTFQLNSDMSVLPNDIVKRHMYRLARFNNLGIIHTRREETEGNYKSTATADKENMILAASILFVTGNIFTGVVIDDVIKTTGELWGTNPRARKFLDYLEKKAEKEEKEIVGVEPVEDVIIPAPNPFREYTEEVLRVRLDEIKNNFPRWARMERASAEELGLTPQVMEALEYICDVKKEESSPRGTKFLVSEALRQIDFCIGYMEKVRQRKGEGANSHPVTLNDLIRARERTTRKASGERK